MMLARMDLARRVGQLFMVGYPATGDGEDILPALSEYHVGAVILTGRSWLGSAATKSTVEALQLQARTNGAVAPLLVAADQEGGQVQVLRGPKFSVIPSALQQGTQPVTDVRALAQTAGAELRAAGVNVNLAPVMDVVPGSVGVANAPIGAYERQFGQDPATVASHGVAFVAGMQAGGVSPTLKHFPGLGRVSGNPDYSSSVVDDVTTRHDLYLRPFAAAISAHAPIVMISTATYTRLDPDRPAAFSTMIVTGMLRGDLGFTGVAISDDLGRAAAVQAWSPGNRAVHFIAAGGDLVLTVDASAIPAMTAAVVERAQHDKLFRAQVDAAVLRVLSLKHASGLL